MTPIWRDPALWDVLYTVFLTLAGVAAVVGSVFGLATGPLSRGEVVIAGLILLAWGNLRVKVAR